jgi:hypothetical protein
MPRAAEHYRLCTVRVIEPSMRRVALVAVVAASVAAGVAGAARQPIDSGLVVVGRGIHGVTLGMTRAQVVARLGPPLSQNGAGYMQYSKRHLFDVYVRGRPRRVDLVTAAGEGFCLSGNICSFRTGSLKRLVSRYGPRLKVELYPEDADAPDYVIRSRVQGQPVNTAFSHGAGRIQQVFIAYAASGEPVFAELPRSARPTGLPVTPEVRDALRAAYCGHIVDTSTCSDPLFHGPLVGRQCYPLENGGQNVCATYRLCRFSIAGAEWAVAAFWLPHSGAEGSGTWFRRGSGGWRAYRELIVPRRLAGLFHSFRCPL